MSFEIDWASLIVGNKCTVFALFYFVFEGNFPSTSPWGGGEGGFIFGGAIGGPIFGGAYFRNSTFFGPKTTSKISPAMCRTVSNSFYHFCFLSETNYTLTTF